MNARGARAKLILREVMVTLVSLAVVAYAIGYVTGQRDELAFAFEMTATDTIATDSVVVYGEVADKSTGKPIRGASLTLAHAIGDGDYEQVGATKSASDGTFRIEAAQAAEGEYRLIAEALLGTGTTRSAFHLDALPGQAYGVSVQLIDKEYFVLLPLPGY